MEPTDLDRPVNERKTLFKALAVLVMLAIAVTGLCYAIHDLWTLPAKK